MIKTHKLIIKLKYMQIYVIFCSINFCGSISLYNMIRIYILYTNKITEPNYNNQKVVVCNYKTSVTLQQFI